MRTSELAKRYSRALFALAKDAGKVEQYGTELADISSAVGADKSATLFSLTPLIRGSVKEAALESCLAGIEASGDVKNFVKLLAKKGRLGVLASISEAYSAEQDSSKGVSRGRIRSARKLSVETQSEIKNILEKVTGKKVDASFEVDQAIVAGIKVEVGSMSIDDSVFGHLNKMREELNRSVH